MNLRLATSGAVMVKLIGNNPVEYYTVPKEIHFPPYNMKCSGEKVILYAEYFMKYNVFHYMSCYIADIWITFRTVYSVHPEDNILVWLNAGIIILRRGF